MKKFLIALAIAAVIITATVAVSHYFSDKATVVAEPTNG